MFVPFDQVQGRRSPGYVLALALTVGACATNPTGVRDGDLVLDSLRAKNKGIVLIDTDMNYGCGRVLARVAHPNAEGHYVQAEEIALKRILNRPGPTEVTLPAGDYGIVQLDCESGPNHRIFMTRPTTRGNILTGEGAVYDRPIATFSVRAGEFINVGNLLLPSRSTGNVLFGPQAEFSAHVVPIRDDVLQKLAAAKPALYSHLVQHLMTTPGSQGPPGPRAAPPAPHAHGVGFGAPIVKG